MKNKKIKHFANVLFRFLFCVMVILTILFLPGYAISNKSDMKFLYKTFVGAESKYQGIIEIWNIDTFESGSGSKTSFLKNRANEFQRLNKGLYFLIRNLTETECLNLLNQGQKPDMFSCSYGVAHKIQNYLTYFSKGNFDISKNFLNSGKRADGNLYGLAWCRGTYVLISTKDRLSKAKIDTTKINSLTEIAFDAGYEYTKNKSVAVCYSLDFGTNKYLLPQKSIIAYNNKGLYQNPYSFNFKNKNQSQYSAYCNFLSNKSTLLIGTQRDIFRMQNREMGGKETEIIYQPLSGFTDLVQYIFLAKGNNQTKLNYAESFAEYLINEESQQKLENIKMFAVKQLSCTQYSGVMKDIALENISVYELNNIFICLRDIEQLQQKFF